MVIDKLMKENHGDGQSFKIVPLMSLKKSIKREERDDYRDITNSMLISILMRIHTIYLKIYKTSTLMREIL